MGRTQTLQQQHTQISSQQRQQPSPQQPQTFIKQVGKNYYEVVVHFSDTSNENIGDKITRLTRNEVANVGVVKS